MSVVFVCKCIGNDGERNTRDTRRDEARREPEARKRGKAKGQSVRLGSAV